MSSSMCVCDRRAEGPGGDVPRARLGHPGLADGLSVEFMGHAGRVLSRRNKRILRAADFMTRDDVAADLRLPDRRGRVEMLLMDAAWERRAS